MDYQSEDSIRSCADLASQGQPLDLVLVTTGILHETNLRPEKSLRELSFEKFQRLFAVNTIVPALVAKHFLPRLNRDTPSFFATLSARVGSIGDNKLGGWYGYRASKAALNQFVRTAAVELKRRKPLAICVALHPGTVESKLSAPFAKSGLEVRSAKDAASQLLTVLDGLTPADSGQFFDYCGRRLPW